MTSKLLELLDEIEAGYWHANTTGYKQAAIAYEGLVVDSAPLLRRALRAALRVAGPGCSSLTCGACGACGAMDELAAIEAELEGRR